MDKGGQIERLGVDVVVPVEQTSHILLFSTTGTKKCLLLAALDIVAKGKRGEGMSQEHLVVLPSSYSWIFSFLSF